MPFYEINVRRSNGFNDIKEKAYIFMTIYDNHIRAEIKNWIKMVEYDLATAQQMFKT